jgi:hypothetical protein
MISETKKEYDTSRLAENYHACLSFLKSIKNFIEYHKDNDRAKVEKFVKGRIELFLSEKKPFKGRRHQLFMQQKIEESSDLSTKE